MASPHPASGSSVLVTPQQGAFFSSRGFNLKTDSAWKIESSEPESTDGIHEFSLSYRHPGLPTAKFSVQTDTLQKEMSLETYAKKWMKDYSSYGFDVLGARTFQNGEAKGLVVDVFHQKKSIQLRQVIFVRKKTAVILTCLDQKSSLEKSLFGCNQIVKTFSWR